MLHGCGWEFAWAEKVLQRAIFPSALALIVAPTHEQTQTTAIDTKRFHFSFDKPYLRRRRSGRGIENEENRKILTDVEWATAELYECVH